MLAYHNDQAVKAFYVNRMKTHIAADEMVHGVYIEGTPGEPGFRGCAVGCTLHGRDHAAYERELGIPVQLGWLHDRVFEGLPMAEAQPFALAALEVIPIGADLSLVWPEVALWLMEDAAYGVLQHVQGERFEQQRTAIEWVAALYRDWLTQGEPPIRENFFAAADYAAAAYAAFWEALRDKLLDRLAHARQETT